MVRALTTGFAKFHHLREQSEVLEWCTRIHAKESNAMKRHRSLGKLIMDVHELLYELSPVEEWKRWDFATFGQAYREICSEAEPPMQTRTPRVHDRSRLRGAKKLDKLQSKELSLKVCWCNTLPVHSSPS
jgi:hypothetical protein